MSASFSIFYWMFVLQCNPILLLTFREFYTAIIFCFYWSGCRSQQPEYIECERILVKGYYENLLFFSQLISTDFCFNYCHLFFAITFYSLRQSRASFRPLSNSLFLCPYYKQNQRSLSHALFIVSVAICCKI